MSKKMLINASHPEENRVAIVVDGILSELDIEIAGQEQTKGNIYKAVVVRVESGLQAAFVDYGAEKMGFLQIGEIHPNLYPNQENPDTKNRPRINDILQRGQEILVQIVKEERGTKGAALTTFLSLPGRYMVLMPDSKTKGVSRKITDERERKQLKKTMSGLNLPELMGYIVRTAGIGKEEEELKRDFDYLVSLYQGIISRKDQIKAPAQLYQESNLVIRSIRDYFSNEMDEVLIDDSKVYQDAKDFFSLVMPEQAGLVKQHRERRPIFSRYQIEEQIDGLARNQIALPSGGSIVIDQTEALVAIDVNSGKMSSESGIEATAGKTNIEAAAEVGRQLRLRDLGGLVVIDFIDMRDRKRIREVEQTLKTSLRDDKAKVTVGRISQFGLLEMSRQRLKAVLSVGAYLDCPHCQGKGRIKSIEAQAIALLRQIHAAASKGHIGKIETRTPLDVANYLLNEKRATLVNLEKQLNLTISIEGRPEFVPGQVELELHKREKPPEQDQTADPISHANQIEDALAAAKQEPPAAEKPTETTETTESPEAPSEGAEESTGRKRRRRRRRRGGRKESDDQQTTSQNAEDTQTAEATEGTTADESTVVEPEVATLEEVTPEASKPAKPRSRSRRGSRKPATEKSPEVDTTIADEKPAAEVKAEDQVKAETPKVHAEEKPKRRAPRKSSAKKATKETTAEPQQIENVNPQGETEKAEAKSTKRPARKTTAKKKSVEQPAKAETAPIETKPATETKAEEKPKRRAPRKSPAKKAETPTTTPSPEVQETKISSAEDKTETKPKRRTTRKTTVAKTAEVKTETTSDADQKPKRSTARKSAADTKNTTVETIENKTEEKPKRRAPRKATPKKASAETVANKTAEPVGSREIPAEVKPKRTRSPKKATAQKSESVAEETKAAPSTAEKISTEEKPKRRAPRKTTTKKATTVVTEKTKKEETDANKLPPAAGKPKRRAPRKKPAKKADDSASVE